MVMLADKRGKRKITWEEFRDMEIPDGDTSIYELINGQIVKRSSPNTPHQRVSHKLNGYFFIYNIQNKVGEFFQAPYDVFFDKYNAGIQPDLLFVLNENVPIIKEGNGIVGIPDLVVEIISPGSVKNDRVLKKDVYERFGVPEYWIMDTQKEGIEVLVLENKKYKLYSFAEKEGIIKSSVLPEFKLDIVNIFEK